MAALPPIDLTLPIQPGMLRFPGDPEPIFSSTVLPWEEHVTLTTSEVNVNLHVGTHIDAPAHFIKGALTIDQLSTELFVGEVIVLNFDSVSSAITRDHLTKVAIPDDAKIFIRTANSQILREATYQNDHVYLKSDAANYLIEKRCRLFGFDYYSVDNSERKSFASHHVFAKAGVPVIVAIDMTPLTAGTYQFSALPIPFAGLEAAPARVVVWRSA